MNRLCYPTPYSDVNAVLQAFESRIREILGGQFCGMYLYGSLALGDFDQHTSDIDFIIVTSGELADQQCNALGEMHTQFDAGNSPWAARIEAAYIPQDALQQVPLTQAKYPQVERGTKLFRAPLESGWVFQLHTLREYGIVISGPDPRTMISPVERASMRQAAAAIAKGWQEQAESDPEWLEWVHLLDAQSFVVLTLCRMLYSLETGDVVSKPVAARWAKEALEGRWAALIDHSLLGQHQPGDALVGDVDETLAFIRFLVEKCLSE